MNFNKRASRFADWCRRHLLPKYIAPYWLWYRFERTRSHYWPAFRRTPAHERKPLHSILRDLLALKGRFIVYLHYGLYRSTADRSTFPDYLDEGSFYYGICYGRGRNHELLDDKLLFDQICTAAGLPKPQLLLYTKAGTVRAADSTILASDAAVQSKLRGSFESLILKPSAGSSGGDGILRCVRGHDGRFNSPSGPIDYARLTSSDSEDILLQEEVQNHPDLSLLSDSLLCLRIMTVSGRRKVRVPCGLLKIAAPGQIADNGHAGGIYVAVNMSSGRLAPYGTNEHLERFERSPILNTAFADFAVPRFDEVLSVVEHAASAFSDLPVVGWDVAVAEAGPVIVEGNSSPSLAMIMKTHHGATQLRLALDELL